MKPTAPIAVAQIRRRNKHDKYNVALLADRFETFAAHMIKKSQRENFLRG